MPLIINKHQLNAAKPDSKVSSGSGRYCLTGEDDLFHWKSQCEKPCVCYGLVINLTDSLISMETA